MSGLPSWARVGAKVVCIATAANVAAAQAKHPWGRYPQSGGTYTIRGFVPSSDGRTFLLLKEVINTPRRSVVGKVEWGFRPANFRPVVTRTQEQDIAEHFGHHLTTPADLERV